jgi:ribosomal protein S18 acetylase RimI-like enzyme
MHVRSLGLRTDLALLTATGSEVEDRGTHLVVRTPANPGFYWGNLFLLGEPPVPGGEREVVGAFRTEFPEAQHVAIGIDGPDLSPESRAAFEAAGLQVDTCVTLTASALVQPLAPIADVEVRPLTSEEDWQARAELGRVLWSTGPRAAWDSYAAARNSSEQALEAEGKGLRLGGFVDGQLVSTAAIYLAEPGLARYQVVETHPDHRRQGIGATVVHAAGQHALTTLGADKLAIVAEDDGASIGIYRRLGFTDVDRQFYLEQAGPTTR